MAEHMTHELRHDFYEEMEPIVNASNLREGDHIAVCRRVKDVFQYFHHGIFISQEEVIEFGASTESDGVVRKVSIESFLKDNFGQVRIVYKTGKTLDADIVVARARELFNDKTKWETYNLIGRNCEHFATFCKTGIAFSVQVEIVTEVVTAAIKLAKNVLKR